MSREPTFYHMENITSATVYYKGLEFTGIAECAPEDMEYMNDRTGEAIALARAEIQYYQYIRDCELIPGYNALHDLQYSFNSGKNYNEHSMEARRIRKHMYRYEEDIRIVRQLLKDARKDLNNYLKEKDKLFHKIDKIKGKKG